VTAPETFKRLASGDGTKIVPNQFEAEQEENLSMLRCGINGKVEVVLKVLLIKRIGNQPSNSERLKNLTSR
jgi:hypothetical protein